MLLAPPNYPFYGKSKHIATPLIMASFGFKVKMTASLLALHPKTSNLSPPSKAMANLYSVRRPTLTNDARK